MEAVITGGLLLGFVATFAKGLYDRITSDNYDNDYEPASGLDHIDYMLYFDDYNNNNS